MMDIEWPEGADNTPLGDNFETAADGDVIVAAERQADGTVRYVLVAGFWEEGTV